MKISAERYFYKYQKCSHSAWVDDLSRHSETIDRLLSCAQSITMTSRYCSVLYGNDNPVYKSAISSISQTRLTLSALRVLWAIDRFVSLKLFYHVIRDENGTEKVQLRPWMAMIADFSFTTCRFFSFVIWLDHTGAIEVGHHEDWMTKVSVALICIGMSISCFQSAQTSVETYIYYKDLDFENIIEACSNALDFTYNLWDCLGTSGNSVAFSIVGSVICVLSTGTFVFKEFYFYKRY